MRISNTPRPSLQLALCAGLVFASSLAAAASQCQGMQQGACAAAVECTWVDGYTRKDGRTVASHCKLKGGKKSAEQAGLGAMRLGRAE